MSIEGARAFRGTNQSIINVFQNLDLFGIFTDSNSFLLNNKNRWKIFQGIVEMKIKRDFITNSSSTSFIIACKSEASDKDDFIDKFNGMLKDYIKKREWDEEFKEPPLLTSDRVTAPRQGVFVIQDFVPVYSNDQDTPQYIQELFLDNDSDIGKLFEQAGIKLIDVKAKDLNE